MAVPTQLDPQQVTLVQLGLLATEAQIPHARQLLNTLHQTPGSQVTYTPALMLQALQILAANHLAACSKVNR